MESGPTQPSTSGIRHPTIAQLRESSHPDVASHLADCAQCQSVLEADSLGSAPIPLELPKGLVTENAFKWPADPIARGGMAAIYAGEDKRLGRTVILKAPREGDDLPAGMAEMFQRRVTAEARILAKLQHPAIVTIHELGKSTVGWPFCVLERVEGTSLRERLDLLAEREKGGKPQTRERLELLSNLVGIAEALAYAHERRIVHRDCTPNNILLGKRGEATLIDWGIARDLDAPGADSDAAVINDLPPSASGRMVTISAGTPPYLPWEQTQGRQADPSYDVYSFGITLYEVVSGTTPFEWQHVDSDAQRGKQLVRFLEWAKSGEPAPPAMPKDRELSGIIARAIDRDPQRRFTADQLVRALKQYLTGDLVFSHRYSLTGRLGRWARRHRGAAVGLVSLIAFVVAGALVWAQLSRRAAKEAELAELTAKAGQVAATASADAANARAVAEKEGREADEAQRLAADAKIAADKAQKEGREDKALRARADLLREQADSKRKNAESLKQQAETAATEANKIKEEAEHQRDLARLARADAEKDRDIAVSARGAAERDRDAAKAARDAADRERDAAVAARVAAERERDAAKSSQLEAERQRDAAREGQGTAEKERDAAVAARAAVEKERDDARRKVAELEQRLRDRPRPPPDQPPPPPPDNNP